MNFIKSNKLLLFILAFFFGMFVWGEATSFKIYKSEYGTKWEANTTHGAIQHK